MTDRRQPNGMISPQVHMTVMANKPCGREYHKLEVVFYKTYRDLKKNLKRHIQDSETDEVSVYRSRRGQWGEWFENWQVQEGKLILVNSGWN